MTAAFPKTTGGWLHRWLRVRYAASVAEGSTTTPLLPDKYTNERRRNEGNTKERPRKGRGKAGSGKADRKDRGSRRKDRKGEGKAEERQRKGRGETEERQRKGRGRRRKDRGRTKGGRGRRRAGKTGNPQERTSEHPPLPPLYIPGPTPSSCKYEVGANPPPGHTNTNHPTTLVQHTSAIMQTALIRCHGVPPALVGVLVMHATRPARLATVKFLIRAWCYR